MFSADLLCTFYRSVSTSDIIRLQEIEQRRNQILGIRAQSVRQFLKEYVEKSIFVYGQIFRNLASWQISLMQIEALKGFFIQKFTPTYTK